MHLIVGLGNPGRMYRYTRHNIGFMVLDRLAERHGTAFVPASGEYWNAKVLVGDSPALLVKPATYMNNSGLAVVDAVDRLGVSPENILIVVDDFHLPLGTVRLRPGGSAGGHHGLESIVYHLQTDRFPRLRCGITPEVKPSGRDAKIDFVLSVFEDGEEAAVKALIDRASDAAMEFVSRGVASAMNKYNALPT